MALKKIYPHPTDDDCIFIKENHTYIFRGRLIPYSVTQLVAQKYASKEAFNADAIIAKYLDTWQQQGATSEYAHIFTVCGKDRQKAARLIKASWLQSSWHGTVLHQAIEEHLEHERQWYIQPPISNCSHIQPELQQFWQWAQHFHPFFIPIRTELVVHFGDQCAGTIDALFQHRETGEYIIVDWKRVKAKYTLCPDEYDGSHNKFHQYSLQVSLYAVLLEYSRPAWKAARCYILRMHAELSSYQWIESADYREQARKLLAAL